MYEELQEIKKMTYEQNEIINKEIETIKRKNSFLDLREFKSRFGKTEERISELENKTF